MIGSLSGVIGSKSPPHLLLEVGGVGYELEAPMSTFYTLPPVGAQARLLTHLVVREDAQTLYAFASEPERQLFRNLLRVSGVGPRIALAILSGVTAAAFAQAVHEQDAAKLTRIPGVGRKTAERLMVEMRDRIALELAGLPGHAGVPGAIPGANGALRTSGPESEAYGALVALGYKPTEATRLLRSVGAQSEQEEGAAATRSTEELIRRALRLASGE